MPAPEDAGGDDVRWLAAQSGKQLRERIRAGFDVVLVDFPPHSTVALDLRVYARGLTRVRAVPPAPAVHVISLLPAGDGGACGGSGPPAAACVATFASAPPGAAVTVAFDDGAATLRVCVSAAAGGREDGEGDEGGEERVGVGERGLAVYSAPHADAWARVAGCVSAETLAAAGGVLLHEGVVTQDEFGDAADSRARRLQGDGGPVTLRFARLPVMRRSAGMRPAEVTAFNMDRSAYVLWLVSSRHGGRVRGLVGELQLAFLSFVLLRSIGALEHWAALVREVCGAADGLAADAPEAAGGFAGALAAQLRLVDADVVAAEGDALQHAVLCLCAAARGVPEVAALARVVEGRFGWVAGAEHS